MSANTSTLYRNCRLAFPDFLAEGALLETDGIIEKLWIQEQPAATAAPAARAADCQGQILAPGLIDIHNHGGLTHDFVSGQSEGNNKALEFHLQNGVTSMLATVMTETREQMERSLQVLAAQKKANAIAPNFLGIHIEGPYFNPEKRGAHRLECLRDPDPREYAEFWKASGGLIRIFTHAPERKGSAEFCRYFHERGCVPAIGHTRATMQEVRRAAACGARHFVHANNAIDWPLRRKGADGWLGTELMGMGALLSHTALTGEIISDGYHVPLEMIRIILNCKGTDHVALVSDSSSAAGCSPGEYELGGLKIILKPGRLVLSGDGSMDGVTPLAGSATPLIDMVRNYIAWGFGLLAPLKMSTWTPARIIGEQRRGLLREGNAADLILIDDQADLFAAVVAGRIRYQSPSSPWKDLLPHHE